MFPWLRRFPDPPQDFSDDTPATTLAQNDRLVLNREIDSPFSHPKDHDLVVELRMVGLRSIHRHNRVIRDRWRHGMALHPQTARVGWVGTLLGGSRNHLFRRGFA